MGAIYSGRRFQLQHCAETSAERVQPSGIWQGCPLSPFLFVMIMSVLMVDAVRELPECDKSLLLKGDLSDLLYADDTLLLSVSASSLEHFLEAVSNSRATYGLELHWEKLQLMRVRSEASVRRPDHTAIEAKPEIIYLGSVVSHDGRVSKELSRRLGMAHPEFRALSRIWRHSSLGRKRKIKIFEATVLPELLYGLAAAWLNKAERRRLDGFQNR